MRPIDRDRQDIAEQRDHFASLLKRKFGSWRTAVVNRVHLRKVEGDELLDPIEADDDFGGEFEPIYQRSHKAGSDAAFVQLQISDADEAAMFSLANEAAVAWAAQRAAELVGMRVTDDGSWVVNPNAEYAIDDATRDMLRTTVTQAMDDGWSNDRLADAIVANQAFSDERAEVIARTETAFADVAGNITGWSASGEVGGKEWETAPDCCDDCQDLDGVVVGLNEDFPGDGGDGPPLHPNCRCDVLPVLNTEDDE